MLTQTLTHNQLKENSEKEAKMYDLNHKKQLRLMVLFTVIIMCHTVTSYIEETLFKHLNFSSPFFMVLVMCALYTVFYTASKLVLSVDKTLLPGAVFGADGDRSIRTAVAFMCLSYAMANSLTKLSLQFVSVPLSIVFKSCKLVAVMLGSTVILGKSYTRQEYLIAFGLVAGMVSFALADLKSSPSIALGSADWSVIIGLGLLLLSLCFDSVLGNLQEKFQKGKICDENELMFVQSLFSVGFLTLYTSFSGELIVGISQCWTDFPVFANLATWGLLNIIGTTALLKVAGEFSAVTAVLTAFCRKFSSLLFSYFLYPKAFNIGHVLGLLLVFGSVGMHARHKQHKKSHAAAGERSDAGDGDVAGVAGTPSKLYDSDWSPRANGERGTDEEMGALAGRWPHSNGSNGPRSPTKSPTTTPFFAHTPLSPPSHQRHQPPHSHLQHMPPSPLLRHQPSHSQNLPLIE